MSYKPVVVMRFAAVNPLQLLTQVYANTLYVSSCDAALLEQGRLDFDRIFLFSGTIAYTLLV